MIYIAYTICGKGFLVNEYGNPVDHNGNEIKPYLGIIYPMQATPQEMALYPEYVKAAKVEAG